MGTKIGICGSCIQVLLAVVNILLFLIGATIFTLAAILRWEPNIIIDKFDNHTLSSVLNLSTVNVISIVLLVIGSFMVLLSMVGLFGTLCRNKYFLIVYEVLTIKLFLIHGISLLVFVFNSSTIEDVFHEQLNKTVSILNDPTTKPTVFDENCKIMIALNDAFRCCGVYGPMDFKYNVSSQCCHIDTNNGCSSYVVDTVKSNAIKIILIPNSVILVMELIFILMVPFLIMRIKRRNEVNNESKGINYMVPTTEFRQNYGTSQ